MPQQTTFSPATEALMQAKGLAVRPMDAALPQRQDGETDGAYFQRLLAESQKAREARQLHETWKRRHLNGLRPQDYEHRLLLVLGELLRSGFLCADYYDTGLPAADRQQATEELQQRGYGELCQISGSDWKYALLRQLLCQPGTQRFIINEDNAGFYLTEMYSQLTWGDAEAFFRFLTFLQLVYNDLDLQELQESKSTHDRLCDKVREGLKPLYSAVSDDFCAHYDEMLSAWLTTDWVMRKLPRVTPNGFQGGFNLKLVCNLVGIFCSQNVYQLTAKQADKYIFTNRTHYTYINNYADTKGTGSEMSSAEIKAVKQLIEKYRENAGS